MTQLSKNLIVETRPEANGNNVITGEGYRISVLTPSLIRCEVQKDGIFTDEATQYIWFRDFSPVKFEVKKEGKAVVIDTEKCRFVFNGSLGKMISVFFKDKNELVKVAKAKNLGGTRRTLDMRNGRVKLEDGVLSKDGVAVLYDDGNVLNASGEIKARKAKEKDFYVFAYGRDYKGAIDAYFALTGQTPMLPRYVLGNWWSRYYAYTQDEYLSLMDRFEKEDIPITVATVDMDWHWVNVNKKFGTNYRNPNPLQTEGWTGYSWNTDLFPDYREFLRKLHEKGLHVTLNLHPADGVRAYEDMYEEMAKEMDVDPATKETISFDLADNKFINAYFDVLHHPYEEEGVDFWWIDWQQGKKSTVKDLDPLWALNHYHFADNCREGRGLVLSRYCGIGAHRYPLGFSGDYRVTWKSLRFQPEFTNLASNIGYDWWSHDIGGHMMGVYDDELYLRWCQYGVFSPINRLHSSNFLLQGKEPWKHSETVRKTTCDYLRLRHALIPYIYTAAYATSKDNVPLCCPTYSVFPEKEEAYKIKNEYFFGSELLVCPVTSKINKKINMAKTRVWIPEGRYTDVFTGRIYQGNKFVDMYRDLEFIPVLAKEGAIIPLSEDEGNYCGNPKKMKVLLYRGNNSYALYEDDDKNGGKSVVTKMKVEETGNTVRFTVFAPEGELALIPENRTIKVCFKDVIGGRMTVNGEVREFCEEISVEAGREGFVVEIKDASVKENPDFVEEVNVIFSRCQGGNLSKTLRFIKLGKIKDREKLRKAIKRSLFPKCVKGAALERLD